MESINVILHDQFKGKGKRIGGEFFIPLSLVEKGNNMSQRWNEREKSLYINVTNAKALEINNYEPQGNYLHYDKNKVENWNVTFTPGGIPKTIYPHGTYYNPATIAQYGLQHYSLYLKNNAVISKNNFLKVVTWFVANQDQHGGWAYHYDHYFYPERLQPLKAPWYSAIGLGQALSILSRAFFLTRNRKYINCALRSKVLFKTPSASHGIRATFENKYSFYEECPTNPPSYILNGFMFALIGLYDLFRATGDREVQALYDEGIVTLKRMLPLYDLGNRTAYDLTHYTTNGGYPNVATWGYHIGHIHLLAALHAIEKDSKMKEALLRWKGYLKGEVK